jgi:hypothetical protein
MSVGQHAVHLPYRKRTARARVQRRAVRIARPGLAGRDLAGGDRGRDLAPGTSAGIQEACPAQVIRGSAIVVHVLRLPSHRTRPMQAEPAQVMLDPRDVLGRGTNRVDILNPEQPCSSETARDSVVQERGIGMTEMQAPVWARREAQDRAHACGPRT